MMATMPVTASSQDVDRRLTDGGYVVVTGMMSPDGAQHARADLDRVLQTTRTGRNSFEGFGTKRIYALLAKTRAFDALAADPLLLGVLDQVLGHYQLSAPLGICIGPGEKAQVLHRDDAIYPVPEPHPPLVVTLCGRWMSSPRRTGLPGSSLAATDGSRGGGRARMIRWRLP
jgi:hypothetical protein